MPVGIVGLLMLLAACGQSDSQSHAAPVILRVGDQVLILHTMLAAAAEDQPNGYAIEWSNFTSGPALVAAETGNSVDVGYMMETPLIFAQAAGSPVKVVAAARRAEKGQSTIALVVAADSTIHAIGDLKGKKIGWVPGTVTQYFVMRLLERADLTLSDVQTVQIVGLNAASLNGVVDALVTGDPHLSQMLAAGQARIVATGGELATDGEPLIPEANYLVASSAAIADPRKSAALGDFITRVARAARRQRENPAAAAPRFAKLYGTSEPIAEQILRRAPLRFGPYDAALIAAHQQEADTFQRLGLIREHIDVNQLFDRRYDSQIAAVEMLR